MHIDPSVLPVVDLVVPHDGVTVGADLDACQGVACMEEIQGLKTTACQYLRIHTVVFVSVYVNV